jgi:hypothetical protein
MDAKALLQQPHRIEVVELYLQLLLDSWFDTVPESDRTASLA